MYWGNHSTSKMEESKDAIYENKTERIETKKKNKKYMKYLRTR